MNRFTRTGIRVLSKPNSPVWFTSTAIRVISDYFVDPNLARFTKAGIRAISSYYADSSAVVRRIYWTF